MNDRRANKYGTFYNKKIKSFIYYSRTKTLLIRIFERDHITHNIKNTVNLNNVK